MTNEKNRRKIMRYVGLVMLIAALIMGAFLLYNVVYGDAPLQPQSPISEARPAINTSDIPRDVKIQGFPNETEENISEPAAIPDPYAGIPMIRLGGIRAVNFANLTSRINNSNVLPVSVNDFNASLPVQDFIITMQKAGDTAYNNVNTTRGKHFLNFEVFGTPPQPVRLLVETNGKKDIVAVYNSKLYSWQPVYVESGEVGLNNSLSVKITFIEDTPAKYKGTKFDRNAYIREIKIITLI